MRTQPYAGALEAVDRILNRESEADEVLRQTVVALHDRVGHYVWVGLFFVEDEELVLGPAQGELDAGAETLEVPVEFEGRQVAALRVASGSRGSFTDDDRVFLERVAVLVSAHCLVGWDTGGIPWSELA